VVRILHSAIKGRARYKVAGLQRSDILREEVEKGLFSHEGVSKFSINPLTGNVLVFYTPDCSPRSIGKFIARAVSTYRKNGGNRQSTSLHSYIANTDREACLSRTRGAGKTALEGTPQGGLIKGIKKIGQRFFRSGVQQIKEWHLMDSEDVLKSLGTSRDTGLTAETIHENLSKYGPNILPESVTRSGFGIFIEQFKSLPVALVSIAAGISIFTGGIAEAVLIGCVVFINAAIGYKTETETERIIHGLKSLIRPSALVLREGMQTEVSADSVLPGDILVLKPGSYVAADARLIYTHLLSVDESVLTGESMPVEKVPSPLSERSVPLADRKNMVYLGTLVTGGQGLAVVVATGSYTETGKIQALIGETTAPETPIERQLNRLGNQLSFMCIAVCGGVLSIGILRGYGFLEMFKISILLAVAAIPEGLPAVAASTLALGIRRMRKMNIMIRRLDAVETLGSVQTICLDKTGTLTMNKMSVVVVHTGMTRYSASDGRFKGISGMINPYSCEELLKLIHITVLCSESEISMREGEYVLSGSPTENALVHMAISSGIDILNLKSNYPLLKVNLRAEERNYMSSLHDTADGANIIAVKGSPSEVLAMCTSYMKDGTKHPLTDDDRYLMEQENDRMAGNALRVLGVAYFLGDDAEIKFEEQNLDNLIWLGLVGMADPIRSGVPQLIKRFHGAGIDTIMITGDQSATAHAIGKELSLSGDEQLQILDSTHLTKIEPDVMKALFKKVNVFARVSPAHKLQIVQALQESGRVVAMTGDGINDGPALKAADIGVSMGHGGTDVAREVADVVLEDDNIETMIVAVSQGRTIYNNIRKSVHYLVSISFSEIMITATAIAGGLGSPLNAKQILYINLMSDIAPAVSLSLEPPEPDILGRPPRDPGEPIIGRPDFKRIAIESAVISAGVLSAYGFGLWRYGRGARAGTMAFMNLVTAHNLHAMSCRSEKHGLFSREKLPPNPYLTGSIAGSTVVQMLAYFIPGLRNFFGMAPISLVNAAVVGGSSTIPLIINEANKKREKKK
jgi:Ca2+-transporting ATPase